MLNKESIIGVGREGTEGNVREITLRGSAGPPSSTKPLPGEKEEGGGL